MSATHLETAIDLACKDLAWVTEALANIGPGGTLSAESNSFFQMSGDLTVQLEHANGLLQVRESALRALREFPNLNFRATPGAFLYQNLDVSYKNGGHLLLQNYVITTWSVYDTLTKVAGILCCTERMYEELKMRAQTFEVLTGGDFAADHADGQDDDDKAFGKEAGLNLVQLPSQKIGRASCRERG